ncbi:MAG TPA: transposase, partial [Candidatus Angelobacter sp.]|nr:transposase [Candidatus Angelobacter sp.]
MTLPGALLELTPRQQLLEFAHVLQSSLIPRLENELGPLGVSARLLVEVLEAVPLQRWLPRNRQGRPKKTRTALAAAFLAKAVYGFTTTRQLLEQFQVDHQMRRCCGWRHAAQLPHEATFSRAFAEFADN